MAFTAEILDFSCYFSESPFHAEVRFIRCEKSRISIALSVKTSALCTCFRSNLVQNAEVFLRAF
ncbi:hypothetical protein CYJ62_06615 [Gardnerella vaginalis]|nr:hypothetical protein CYJ62_06615 [Gardnerella vaginalis]